MTCLFCRKTLITQAFKYIFLVAESKFEGVFCDAQHFIYHMVDSGVNVDNRDKEHREVLLKAMAQE